MLEYFKLNKVKDNPFRVIIITISIFLILIYGYLNQNYIQSSMMSIGLFALFYYKNIPMKNLIYRLLIIGLSIIFSFILGLLASKVPFYIPFAVSIVAFFSRFFMRLYGITRPGALFPVMLASMGASLSFPLSQIPFLFINISIGAIISIIGGVIIKLLDKRDEIEIDDETLINKFHRHPLIILDSIFFSMALFVTVYISNGFYLEKPYWMTMGCASILLAENLETMRKRHVQFVLGAIVGLSIAGFIMSLNLNDILLIIFITILYGLSQYFIIRNYGVANFFLNPMALMLSSLLKGTQVYSLIQDRFIGIVVGSFIGFGVAWMMNYALEHYLKIVLESDDVKEFTNN